MENFENMSARNCLGFISLDNIEDIIKYDANLWVFFNAVHENKKAQIYADLVRGLTNCIMMKGNISAEEAALNICVHMGNILVSELLMETSEDIDNFISDMGYFVMTDEINFGKCFSITPLNNNAFLYSEYDLKKHGRKLMDELEQDYFRKFGEKYIEKAKTYREKYSEDLSNYNVSFYENLQILEDLLENLNKKISVYVLAVLLLKVEGFFFDKESQLFKFEIKLAPYITDENKISEIQLEVLNEKIEVISNKYEQRLNIKLSDTEKKEIQEFLLQFLAIHTSYY